MKLIKWTAAVAALVALALPVAASDFDFSGRHGDRHRDRGFFALLTGGQEVPALSTTGMGRAFFMASDAGLAYEVRWANLEGEVGQAHIHFAQAGVNGGVATFLCSNMGNGPEGTPECGAEGVSGVITPESVLGPEGQGIEAGAFDELVKAMRKGLTYVNVHTTAFPSGEVRGQIRGGFGFFQLGEIDWMILHDDVNELGNDYIDPLMELESKDR